MYEENFVSVSLTPSVDTWNFHHNLGARPRLLILWSPTFWDSSVQVPGLKFRTREVRTLSFCVRARVYLGLGLLFALGREYTWG